jgi:hypothetical protein
VTPIPRGHLIVLRQGPANSKEFSQSIRPPAHFSSYSFIL